MSRHSSRSVAFQRRRASMLAHNDTCWVCGYPGATTIDHLIPRAAGGSDDPSNLRPAHLKCNITREARVSARVSRVW